MNHFTVARLGREMTGMIWSDISRGYTLPVSQDNAAAYAAFCLQHATQDYFLGPPSRDARTANPTEDAEEQGTGR